MKYSLSNICKYSKDKINTNEINLDNYISTENMLPNKCGITRATSLPNTKTINKFKFDDILISNIRPYFKKIWFADINGGCSNDILVFSAINGINSKYLYYVLSNNEFFDYATLTSKGTKMPRGDKIAIMNYQVSMHNLSEQEKIARLLSSLDNKIELNNKINNNLVA